MKKLLFCLSVVITGTAIGQTYDKQNISLVGQIAPNTTTNTAVNRYAGCWGWYQASKNKEYAISGASNGTYFIDVTSPATPTVSDFVPSRSICTWREIKTYQHYAYIVSDVCMPNSFQIVDLQYLPDSVHVVHDDTALFILGHTLWIDNNKMYVASTRINSGLGSPMTVWSLANPEAPVLLRRVEQDISSIAEVHDMYVRNDTCYVSAAWAGLRVVKFNTSTNTFTQLGSYSGYPFAGYNHSSALTANSKYLVFCDELPAELPIHVVDVQNIGNIQSMTSWHPYPKTTPHNPFVIGNQWAVVSCYQDGLFIYDISVANNVKQTGFFDTFYQGGFNTGSGTVAPNYGGSAYNGNWGAYPYLPSKIIIANDMTNGVYLLDATAAYTTSTGTPVDVHFNNMTTGLNVYPNPVSGNLNVRYDSHYQSQVQISNLLGQFVMQRTFEGNVNERLDLNGLPVGTYLITVTSAETTTVKKLIISR